MSRRPNRWEAARDPNAAARRTPVRTYGTRRTSPTWSMPVPRALRILACVIAAMAVWSYRAELLAFLPW